jgi:hypothetical protein
MTTCPNPFHDNLEALAVECEMPSYERGQALNRHATSAISTISCMSALEARQKIRSRKGRL